MRLTLKSGMVITGTICLVSAIYLAFATDGGHDLTRFRNAFLYDVAPRAAFEWTPSSVPESFKWEAADTPSSVDGILKDIAARQSTPLSGFDGAYSIALYLVDGPEKTGYAIQSDTYQTFTRIKDHGDGYCADYSQVLNGIALAADIPVREWGMTFEGFGREGHAFNEVFDPALEKWVFVDSFYSLIATDIDGTPLSVLELRDYLYDEAFDRFRIVPISDEKFMFPDADFAARYYARGADEFFMIWGNNVFSYDERVASGGAGVLSRIREQVTAMIVGVMPQIRILDNPRNRNSVGKLSRIRYSTGIGFLSGLTFGVLLLVFLVRRITGRDDQSTIAPRER